jgi:small subunit ribosomal protein S20
VPNTASAAKRVRQSVKRKALNHWRQRRIKDQVKSFLQAVQANDAKAAQSEFSKVCGILDKIACTRTIHPNKAARTKSRLSRRLAAMTPARGKR